MKHLKKNMKFLNIRTDMDFYTMINNRIKDSLDRIFRRIADPLEYNNLKISLVDYLDGITICLPEGVNAPDRISIFVNPVLLRKHRRVLKAKKDDLESSLLEHYRSKELKIINPMLTVEFEPDPMLGLRSLHFESAVSTLDQIKTVLLERSCSINCLSGEYKGKTWTLQSKKKLTFGRHKLSNIEFTNRKISREHASLEMDKMGRIFITDTGSSNGTFINNDSVPLKGRKQLKSNDRFSLCAESGIDFQISRRIGI